MNRSLKVGALVFAFVAWVLLSQALYAGPAPDHDAPALEAASICISAPWMPHVSITRSALSELRERMARYNYPTGICITGPFEQDCRAPESVEEAWLIEKLYGPAPRWVLHIVPLQELVAPSVDPGESFYLREVCGIAVGIHTSKTVSRLSIELYGDAIRLLELDA
jgi:hypothetical protein